MKFCAVILITVSSAILYGLVHDQITIRISEEYFTVGHPRIFAPSSLTVLAIKWSIVATWWAGLAGGIALAIAARKGDLPKYPFLRFFKGILRAWAIMFASAIGMGVVGYLLASYEIVAVPAQFIERVPEPGRVSFVTAEFMHDTSYLIGLLCVVDLFSKIRLWRKSLAA